MANEVWCCEDEDWEINCEEMRYLANDVTYQEEATGQRRMTACIPGHLASPIYGEEVDMLMSGKKIRRSCYRHRKVRAHIEQCTSFRELTDPMGSLELWIMGRPISKSTVDMRMLRNKHTTLYTAQAALSFVRELYTQAFLSAWVNLLRAPLISRDTIRARDPTYIFRLFLSEAWKGHPPLIDRRYATFVDRIMYKSIMYQTSISQESRV